MRITNFFKKLLIITIFSSIILSINVKNFSYATDPTPASNHGALLQSMEGADEFLKAGETVNGDYVNGEKVEEASSKLYNVFATIGVITALIIGVILGIQFITAGVEEKAKVKESLIAYFIGIFVLFGAYEIWKFVATVLPTLVDV